ncbi:hypothetical protein [Halarcobacter sp.]|uniref:hypothetical protein n=1 Tax=Halarcobacter sp. TaxID=2321133 RepID=UPI003A8F4A8E
MTETEAEAIIKESIPSSIKGEVVEVIKRNPISRLEHEALFAVIFKYDKTKTLEMVKATKNLSISNPDFEFSGSDVDDKYNLENTAVFISAKCK